MKFKTVSEFIYALEVEGKKFINSVDTDEFLAWSLGRICRFDNYEDFVALNFLGPVNIEYIDLDHDWQECQPEPETEEIELEEVLTVCEDGSFCAFWVERGGDIKSADFCNPIKTGVTRKVKVPK